MGSSSKKDTKKGKSVAKLPETDKKKRQQPQVQPSYGEFMADVGSEYSTEEYEAGPSNAIGAQSNYPRHRAIQSESAVTLQGPLQVAGGVVSGGNVTLSGDFDIRGRIDSYGTIDISGSVVCTGQIQAYGNIVVRGSLSASEPVKGFGKLRTVGTCDAQDLEIYGNMVIDGYLKCRSLTLYGSLTLIGETSGYLVEGQEEVWGAKMLRDEEVQW
ncbi:hypothetical protein B0T11DRAFT_342524 [Plectosphaerella cucumerina]|uniref:Polymer-forming cytoskeletal protein n=1 Tax=Plectosphaerella cucumerina TaxID=40658 RepID=A0A8K0X0E7_9PEZI|nr:hypothetical protein B0T11DRAFT_342524 [Plectosphaerella cucumerina]